MAHTRNATGKANSFDRKINSKSRGFSSGRKGADKINPVIRIFKSSASIGSDAYSTASRSLFLDTESGDSGHSADGKRRRRRTFVRTRDLEKIYTQSSILNSIFHGFPSCIYPDPS